MTFVKTIDEVRMLIPAETKTLCPKQIGRIFDEACYDESLDVVPNVVKATQNHDDLDVEWAGVYENEEGTLRRFYRWRRETVKSWKWVLVEAKEWHP